MPFLCTYPAYLVFLQVVTVLLAAGASVSSADKALWVPLHWASQNGYEAVVDLLLQAGAEVEVPDAHGVRPLHLAAQSGNDKVVNLLLQSQRGIKVRLDSVLHQGFLHCCSFME